VSEETVAAAEQQGLNLVLLIQVPLKQAPREVRSMQSFGSIVPAAPAPSSFNMAAEKSDVETAVIGSGAVEGPFTEVDNLAIERDPNFPIRVTVQFYKGTSNGVISRQDVAALREQIERVYADADYVGSLVIDGPTGRPTEYTGSKVQPPAWWDDFWWRYEANTGESRQDAMERLRKLHGENWMPASPRELDEELRRR
jgi:hypothetical protein